MGQPVGYAERPADCKSAIRQSATLRYCVRLRRAALYRRLLTGYGCATTCANFVNGPDHRAVS